MKNIKAFILLTLLATVPALNFSAIAQSYTETNGYWQVHTDPKSKNTVVVFFDQSQQPIYQETMPRKYIKLTKKNIRHFDNLLKQLMSRNLLSSKIRTYDLVADSRTDFRDVTAPVNRVFPVEPASPRSAAHNVYMIRTGKMRVILRNPALETYDVTIIDDQLRTVYHEPVNASSYGRWFDLSKLEAGTYKVRITGPRKALLYHVTVGEMGYALEQI